MIPRRNFPTIAFIALLILARAGPLPALSDFYWEDPALFIPQEAGFPVSAFNDRLAILAWQEHKTGQITVSMVVKVPGQAWSKPRTVGGPYAYSGDEPAILSVVVDSRGRIILALAASASETEILISGDRGESFQQTRLNNGAEGSVAPRIYPAADGGYLLFVTRGSEESLSIFYSRSDDGTRWAPFQPFVDEADLPLSFLPTHASLSGIEYVVFQSYVGGSEEGNPTFQLFLKTSSNGGRTWTAFRRITSFLDPYRSTDAEPEQFDNQRPHLSVQDGRLFLVWERRYAVTDPNIYGVYLDAEGEVAGRAEQINNESAHCNNPVAVSYQGESTVVWFDNRRGGNRVFLAQKGSISWENQDLSGNRDASVSFARPVVCAGNGARDDLVVFWQALEGEKNHLYTLAPDATVAAPRITMTTASGGRAAPSRRSRAEQVRLSWTVPYDSSGIRSFAYRWGRTPGEVSPRSNPVNVETTAITATATEDGNWYFSIIAEDFAGNWSAPAVFEYIRDRTPPPAAVIIPPALDSRGFLPSNTFTLSWNPPPASDVAGYTWTMDCLVSHQDSAEDASFAEGLADYKLRGDLSFAARPAPKPTPRIMGKGYTASFDNADDGLWRFTVFPIDEAGNIGPGSSVIFPMNKYVPHTFITTVYAAQDLQNTLAIRVVGRGFKEGGDVVRVLLDRDGKAPYDREYPLKRGEYRVSSDREITDFRIEDIGEGRYRLGVEHPLRGFAWSDRAISVDKIGTLKFGDFTQGWDAAPWKASPEKPYRFDMVFAIIIAIMVFCGVGMAAAIRGLASVTADSVAIRLETIALITGELMPMEKKRRLKRIRKRDAGLRLKLASFTIALVLLVVTMVSVPLYLIMTRTQEETLLKGLWDRSSVLMEGFASSARVYLPSQNTLELGFLPAQTAAIPEARYVTISGFGYDSTIFADHVWATNDPDIMAKIDTAVFEPGRSRLEDTLSQGLDPLAQSLDARARAEVGFLSTSIISLNQQYEALPPELRIGEAGRAIQDTTRGLQTQLTERLNAISAEIRSEPAFPARLGDTGAFFGYSEDLARLLEGIRDMAGGLVSGLTARFTGIPTQARSAADRRSDPANTGAGTNFILYKPVMFRQGAEDVYFRGLIRLEVSIDSIIAEIANDQRALMQVILMVALTAILIGALGALVLAAFIIRPIKKLVTHVERIRDTDNKAKLAGVDITIKSRDEIAVLGNTINDMTHGLVKAALASQDLTIGKEVQKKFIPLETDKEGNKLSSGFKDTKNVQFFGYYEGAKGVSGDYFDYLDLDGRYFALIKCDVAGKGIPAALIMIQVATMFLTYFKAWKPTEKGMHIEELVYQINDFIETMGFKGRFAAFTLALFDSATGLVRFCNAGDNIVHLYDSSEQKMKALTLPQTPATGVLPNFMVENKGGYPVQTLTVDHGDLLLLYTDGIEEAKRKFRDDDFREILCTEGNAPVDTPHANHVVGQADEEMGADRVEAIINAVMNKRVYTLSKYHNPEGDMALEFDFTGCKGSVEETIMAMVSVEKMFRIYRDPRAGEDARVLVEKKIDSFLKEHFRQYREYCAQTRENPDNEAYMYYTHVNEDEQYDDLTILGINRK